MFEDILTLEVFEALLTFVATFLMALLGKAAHHFGQVYQDQYVHGVIQRAHYAALDAVRYTQHTLTKNLKASSPNGKLTTEEVAVALKISLEQFKVQLGESGVSDLAKVVGPVDAWFQGKVEALLHVEKARSGPDVREILELATGIISGLSDVLPEMAVDMRDETEDVDVDLGPPVGEA